MFERTFMWKMFVKLCAGFWPENANTFSSILIVFVKWNIIVTASYGIGYDCWPDQYKKGKGWGLGARRLATHTHTNTYTCITIWIAKWESEVWPPAKVAIRPHKWGTIMRPKSRYVDMSIDISKKTQLVQWEVPPADVPTAKRSRRPEPRQPGME